jgi:hypothetical protein
MGKSGGSKTKSKSWTGSAQKWAQPYAQAGAGAVQNVYNKNQPGLQAMTDLAQKQVVPALAGKFNAGLGLAGQSRGYVGDVLSGKYLSGNPHLEGMIGLARDNVGNQVNSNFSLAGRYGSGAHNQMLAKGLGEAELGLRYGNYSDEMARMSEAAQLGQAFNSEDLEQLRAMMGTGAALPYIGSSEMANSLGALFQGGYEKSKGKQGSGLLGSALSAGASIGSAAIMASDRRLKKNIEKIGEFEDGLGIYEWEYKFDPSNTRCRGVMADEVKELRPQAYVANFRAGYAGVNYAAL